MKDVSNLEIHLGSGIIRIIANEVMISTDLFNWHDHDQYGGWLTLKEISDRLQQLGYGGVFYVWEDTPLSVTIYQCGNYEPDTWIKYGTTMGFA